MNDKGFASMLLVIIAVVVVVGIGGYFVSRQRSVAPSVGELPTQKQVDVTIPSRHTTPSTSSAVTLDLSSDYNQRYITLLTEAFQGPTSFDEHYVVAEIGCGTGCFGYAVIDKNTGMVYQVPVGNDIGQFTGEIGPAYSLHSNLIKVITENGSKMNTYAFNGNSFSLVSSVPTDLPLRSHTSNDLNITFQYPSDWTIQEGRSGYPGTAQGENYLKLTKGSDMIYAGTKTDCLPNYTYCKTVTPNAPPPSGGLHFQPNPQILK